MADQSAIRCPQCATMFARGEAQCPHCGLPQAPQDRIQEIERLLKADAPPMPTRPVAPVEPITAGFRPPQEPRTGGSVSLQWEQTPGKRAADADRPRGWLKRHGLVVGITGSLALLVGIAVAVSLLLQSFIGYRSSPENLVRGIQTAIDTGDTRLFIDLMTGPDADVDNLLTQLSGLLTGTEDVRLETEDVIMGKNGNASLVIIQTRYPSPMEDGTEMSQRQTFVCYKQDGQWYMDGNMFFNVTHTMYQ